MLGTTEAKGFGSSNLGVAWGRRLKVIMHDVRAQHRDVPEGLLTNVATLRPTLRRSRRVISQHHDVEIQCRDVTERGAN